MFILRGILRSATQEKVLAYLVARERGYGREIALFFGASTNAVQKQLARMEQDGLVVAFERGRTLEYQLNPRYPFIEPLKSLVKAAIGGYPKTLQMSLLMERTRPRALEKPMVSPGGDSDEL